MTTPKTIAIDARELRTTTGRYVERLLHYLQLVDNVNYYQVLLTSADIESWHPTNPNFTKIVCDYREFTFDEQLGYKKQLDQLDADLVHFTSAQQPIWYKGKAVTTIHDLTTARFTNPDKQLLIFKLKQQVYKYVVKKVAHKSAAILTPTKFVKDDLMAFSRINADKITVTLESADPVTPPATPLPNLQNKQFIMYLGRPTPHKNLPRLIEAFALLRAQHSELYLVLAGKKDANYERIAAGVPQELRSHVHFTGFVSEAELKWLYQNCAAYVFPSLSEGFGLPGLEAMINGAPVVSSNATCLPEVYGSAAHYFDPLNVQNMAQAIDEVITDMSLRRKLIAAGRQQVKLYSWTRMAEQTLTVYQAVS